jgi:hypothetical protein
MKEIRGIRLRIFEDTKHMTAAEFAVHAHAATVRLEQMYGIKFRRPGDPRHSTASAMRDDEMVSA